MTPKFTDLLDQLLEEWSKHEYKRRNYTGTQSRTSLLKFISRVEDWTMHNHCVEDREAMTQRDTGRVVAEISSTADGKTTVRKIYSKLDSQIEVDERRTAYEEGLDKHDIH
jgi:hypothetical protein